MKKFILIIGVMFSLINLSCSESDDTELDTVNQVEDIEEIEDESSETDLPSHFTFEGKDFHGQSRLVVDYNEHFNHRDYMFFMVDTKNYDWRRDPVEAKFQVMLDIYSPGIDKFRPGTFEFVDISMDDNGDAVEGKFFFNYFSLHIDTNGDNKLTNNDKIFEATGGTIIIEEGSEEYQYTITFDITMNNNKKLTGKFTETWEYFN